MKKNCCFTKKVSFGDLVYILKRNDKQYLDYTDTLRMELWLRTGVSEEY